MKVLVACEFSGTVGDAFTIAGHDVLTCDLIPSESSITKHYQGDVRGIIGDGFDLMIAHPDCTHLTLAGARWFTGGPYVEFKHREREKAIDFFCFLLNSGIKKVAIENPQPLGYVMERVGRYDQKVQPWQFGEPETKGICLWQRGLLPLKSTKNVYDDMMRLPYKDRARIHSMGPSPSRKKDRSRFYKGIAKAMAEQWGKC